MRSLHVLPVFIAILFVTVCLGQRSRGRNRGKSNGLNPMDFQAAESISENDLEDWIAGGGKDPILTSGKFEGDITFPKGTDILSFVDSVELGDPDAKQPGRTAKGSKGKGNNAIRGLHSKWPGAKIPYVISGGFSARDRAVIAAAVAQYDAKTCIRWVPRTNQRDYVNIIRSGGCYSMVGRTRNRQDLSLGNNCVTIGITVHEMMHAIGFFHEQSRNDRDQYISIIWNNISPGVRYAFNKYSLDKIDHLNTKYDYGSVMHYHDTAFSTRWGAKTIVPKQAGVTLGNRKGLSANDVVKLNRFYSCEGTGGGNKGGTKTTAKPTTAPPTGTCVDKSPHCSYWKKEGYCTRTAAYMKLHCPKACGKCGGGGGGGGGGKGSTNCRDTGAHCADWKRKGECTRNAAYMKVNCKRSCGLCSGGGGGGSSCKDTGRYCADWKRKGECTKNAAYMKKNCKMSCGVC